MKEEEKIDQLFKNNLEEYTSEIPTDLWDKIDAARHPEKRRNGIIWWRYAGILALVLFATTTIYFFNTNKNNASETLPTIKQEPVNIPEIATPIPVDGNKVIEKTNTISPALNVDETTANNNPEKPIANSFNSTQKTSGAQNTSPVNNTPKFTHLDEISENKVNTAQPISENTAQPDPLKTTEDTVDSASTISTTPTIKTTSNAVERTMGLNVLTTERFLASKLPEINFKPILHKGPKGCYSFAGGRIRYDFYVDAFVAPEYTIRSLTSPESENASYRDARDESETNMYGLTTGVRVSLVSRHGLALRSGIIYSQILEKLTIIDENFVQINLIIDETTGDTISNTTQTGTREKTTYNRYRSLDIPLLLGYEIEAKRFVFSINSGVTFNILARQKGEILNQSLQPAIINTNNPQRIQAFENKLGMGIFGSVGINYKLKGNLQLMFEPNLRYDLKPITLSSYPLEQQYIRIGVITGLRMQF